MRVFLLCLVAGALAFYYQQGWLENAGLWWRHLGHPEKQMEAEAEMDGKAVTGLLATRKRLGTGLMMPDIQLQQWLLEKMQNGIVEPEALADAVQLSWPQYIQVAVFRSRSFSGEGLLTQLGAWSELSNRELTHLAVVVEPAFYGFGWQATVLAGHKLPPFSPEALNNSQEKAFFTTCTLCKKGQACEIPRHSRSLSLECPHCHRVYAMLAANTLGKFHYVNEYLTGYAPPARFPKHQTRLQELMTIWKSVAGGCRYAMDNGDDSSDAWQIAPETQARGQGDCEDSSILLADWLLARDFQARVALGRYAERGGHAWVVVRLEDQDYLLESTEGASEANRPPLLSEVGSRYVPEILFDPMAFYIRTQPTAPWSGDFWSEKTWQRVSPRSRYSRDGKMVSQVQGKAN